MGADNNSCKTCYYACVTCITEGNSTNHNCKTCDSAMNRELVGSNCECPNFYKEEEIGKVNCIKSTCPEGQSFNALGECKVICGDMVIGEG